MNTITILLKRNIKLFLRDKAAVFFSLLSALIVLFLYLLFIAKIYVSGMTEAGIPLSAKEMNFMIYNNVFASVIILNSISIPIGVFTIMAKDLESKKTDSFLISTVNPLQLLISYFVSAFILAAIINGATWFIGTIAVGCVTGLFLSTKAIFICLLITLIVTLVSSMIMSIVVTVIRSSTALNVFGGVAGTFFGFICGIYMPYSALGAGMKNVGSLFPFTHLTIWFKQIIVNDCFAQFELSDAFKTAIYEESFSATNIGFWGLNIPLWAMLVFSGIVAIGCLIGASVLLKKRIKEQK